MPNIDIDFRLTLDYYPYQNPENPDQSPSPDPSSDNMLSSTLRIPYSNVVQRMKATFSNMASVDHVNDKINSGKGFELTIRVLNLEITQASEEFVTSIKDIFRADLGLDFISIAVFHSNRDPLFHLYRNELNLTDDERLPLGELKNKDYANVEAEIIECFKTNIFKKLKALNIDVISQFDVPNIIVLKIQIS